MKTEQREALGKFFKHWAPVKLVYLFGSRATGRAGLLSDYDFGVYIDGLDRKARFDLGLEMADQLSRVLKTDKIDLKVINDIRSPDLKYRIIKEGWLLFAREPYQVLIEPRILSEYFDFHSSLKRAGLTKANP